MDMMTTSMGSAMVTKTPGIPIPSSATGAPEMSMPGMPGMDMGSSVNCKSSMFWNWYTLDACFLSTTWHITSRGMFVGSCICVIGLVLLLEFSRRLQREYDRLIQQHATYDYEAGRAFNTSKSDRKGSADSNDISNMEDPPHSAVPLLGEWERSLPLRAPGHVPSVLQQAIRAGIYTLQFSVAYLIMLLAMYYNGYILVCVFIGAFIGFFIFSWDASGAASM
ncbi:hypothetical protein HO133_006139 [Letharia lupina]|uniref:Copper transport protein n=1 Tax=Letharia lupina TaxID=560253 RepID=A0A8H6F7L1_9LECA|nr:uncharacterized protein HO133_006139 [Letharia lupina]KAF6218180.1 hypothetical protein HO133_006139 [Letharia lupina]